MKVKSERIIQANRETVWQAFDNSENNEEMAAHAAKAGAPKRRAWTSRSGF